MNCKFCDKQFANVYSLNYHQLHTKKCVLIQKNIDTKEEKIFKCSFCEKTLSSNPY